MVEPPPSPIHAFSSSGTVVGGFAINQRVPNWAADRLDDISDNAQPNSVFRPYNTSIFFDTDIELHTTRSPCINHSSSFTVDPGQNPRLFSACTSRKCKSRKY
jgi:hypothetical protein